MRSKAHTALTAPLVLHHTRIYKCTKKKIIINGRMRNNLFLIVIYHSSLVKASMNAACVCKLRNGVNKTPQFLFFQRQNWAHTIIPFECRQNCLNNLAAGALQTWVGLTLDSCKYHPVYGTAGQTPLCINFAYHTPTWYSWYWPIRGHFELIRH